jgi:hypothetical protein
MVAWPGSGGEGPLISRRYGGAAVHGRSRARLRERPSASIAARRLARRARVVLAVVGCAVFATATSLARSGQRGHARHAVRPLTAPAPLLAVVRRDLAEHERGAILPAATVADPTSGTS